MTELQTRRRRRDTETDPLDPDSADFLAAVERDGLAAGVFADTLTRALYATDASLYRVLPKLVARPRSTDELISIVKTAAEHRMPITTRGAGTSIAGNAVGPGLILNTSKHLNKIISIDEDARTATVEPGVVHAELQREASAVGLRFGPDPSSHTRCTIGGMIGNNACGSRALGYGRTSDNLVELDLVTI